MIRYAALLALVLSAPVAHAQDSSAPTLRCGVDAPDVRRALDGILGAADTTSAVQTLREEYGVSLAPGVRMAVASPVNCERVAAALEIDSFPELTNADLYVFESRPAEGAAADAVYVMATSLRPCTPDQVCTGTDLFYVLDGSFRSLAGFLLSDPSAE
jgi:hypothetical protein